MLKDASDHDLLIQHTEKIDSLCKIVRNIDKKLDDFLAPDGMFMDVKTFQASCPREEVWRTISRQWKALGILASVVAGTIVKMFWKAS